MYFDCSPFVLINGTPSGFFRSSRGVRQGDPLSSFLFVIVMKAFSRMIAAAIDHGFISGFSMGSSLSERVFISHLLFVDDTLVFCGANLDQIRYIKALLVCFEAMSSLKVNMAKSALVLVGNVVNLGVLAGVLGCGTAFLHLKYLDIGFKVKPIWMISWKRLIVGWLAGKDCVFPSEVGLL
jgi:hypothetical protein